MCCKLLPLFWELGVDMLARLQVGLILIWAAAGTLILHLTNYAPCTTGNILPGCPETMRNSLPITRGIIGRESGAFTLAGGGE